MNFDKDQTQILLPLSLFFLSTFLYVALKAHTKNEGLKFN